MFHQIKIFFLSLLGAERLWDPTQWDLSWSRFLADKVAFYRLLVAASAIIPVWGFPKWHYFNLKTVCLLPAAFNDRFECGQPDSNITGMVGTGPMNGKMVLCKPSLYRGFENSRDKQNVGIHEFVHLVDMMDGECDGYPERL